MVTEMTGASVETMSRLHDDSRPSFSGDNEEDDAEITYALDYNPGGMRVAEIIETLEAEMPDGEIQPESRAFVVNDRASEHEMSDGERQLAKLEDRKKWVTKVRGFAGVKVGQATKLRGSIDNHDKDRVTVLYNVYDDFYKVGYLEQIGGSKGAVKHVSLYGRIRNVQEVESGEAKCIKWDYCVRSPMSYKFLRSSRFIRYPVYGEKSKYKLEEIENGKANELHERENTSTEMELIKLENVDTLIHNDVVYLEGHVDWTGDAHRGEHDEGSYEHSLQSDAKSFNLERKTLKFTVCVGEAENESEHRIRKNAGWRSGYRRQLMKEIKPAPPTKFNVNMGTDLSRDAAPCTMTYVWIDDKEFKLEFPPGKYDLSLLNRVLHNYMDVQRHFCVRKSDKARVYLLEFEAHREEYQIDLKNPFAFVYLRRRSIEYLLDNECEYPSAARKEGLIAGLIEGDLPWVVYAKSMLNDDTRKEKFVQCKDMSNSLKEVLGFAALPPHEFPTIDENICRRLEGHTAPPHNKFRCYLSKMQRWRDLYVYVKRDVCDLSSAQKVMDVTLRSDVKGEEDDGPGDKWFNKITRRLKELPQLRHLAQKLLSNFEDNDETLQDKDSLYEEFTKVRYDVLKSFIFNQKKWVYYRMITSTTVQKRATDGDMFQVLAVNDEELIIDGRQKYTILKGGKGRDSKLYDILKFISSFTAIIFNDLMSMALIALYIYDIAYNGPKYATVRRLLGVAIIFVWVPHLLSICLTRHYYGHSKINLLELSTPIKWLRKMLEKQKSSYEKRGYTAPFAPKKEIDMEHTLPFILTHHRVKRGVMGCYHLCNTILLYNFVLNMMHAQDGKKDEFHIAGGSSVDKGALREGPVVNRIMLSRVLQRAEPQLFNRFIRLAMYAPLLSIPATFVINLYQFNITLNSNLFDAIQFIFWLWYSPYIVACASHAIALFCFTLHAHTLDIEMFIERLNADRIVGLDKKSSGNRRQWVKEKAFLEEYLFHQLLVRKSSDVWELSLSASLICAMTLFVLGAVTFSTFRDKDDHFGDNESMNSLLFVSFGLIGFVSIFHAIAMLNGRLKKPILTATEASSSDWNQLADKNLGEDHFLGGRDRLLAYFQSNPIAFKIYGVEINFQMYIIVGSSMFSIFLVVVAIYLKGE